MPKPKKPTTEEILREKMADCKVLCLIIHDLCALVESNDAKTVGYALKLVYGHIQPLLAKFSHELTTTPVPFRGKKTLDSIVRDNTVICTIQSELLSEIKNLDEPLEKFRQVVENVRVQTNKQAEKE